MAENIVHLVLARVTGAPEGVKGISLFVVPKFLVNKDGSLGLRNDVQCVSIEHKMGIKASPTGIRESSELPQQLPPSGSAGLSVFDVRESNDKVAESKLEATNQSLENNYFKN